MKGSQRVGGVQIFLKTFCASLFNEILSNEPNFRRIHLAGQYLLWLPTIQSWYIAYPNRNILTIVTYSFILSIYYTYIYTT